MADVTISPDEIRDALKDFVKSYDPTKATRTEVGYVVDAADGIAHVEGLPGVMANELIKFADGTLGLALSLDESEIGVVVLGEFTPATTLTLDPGDVISTGTPGAACRICGKSSSPVPSGSIKSSMISL